MPWTKANLKAAVTEKLGSHKLIVVSNREPYVHSYSDQGVRWSRPASGMAVALDPVMRACGGTWVAFGSGEADREVVDAGDHVQVPPENPRYTLRRVWLTKEEEEGYYNGYANEGLWPLCHTVFVRPSFREADWQVYRSVNQKFAEAVLEEMGDEQGVVFVQDYHFALLPRLIKDRRPDIITVQFWHIPWPNPDTFRVCPHAEDILWGLLGNDILGFHIRYHCLNFLDTVDRFMETRIDRERLSVIKEGRETLVRPYPISIDAELIEATARSPEVEKLRASLRAAFRLRDRKLIVGIDRMDYIKGITERFNAIDRFLEQNPQAAGQFVFAQLGPVSRIQVRQYQGYNDEIYHRMIEINEKHRVKDWQPILLRKVQLDFNEVISYYLAADLLVVSSIHDGMNLVAKEFVAARFDGRGVLLLSKFTGSARELGQALLVNPMATEEFAEAIQTGLNMPPEEQAERMKKMRETVAENNVYRWAGKIVGEMKKLM
jgi:trehalose-6-phosphate synthase